MELRSRKTLLVLLLVFIASRLAILFTSDDITHAEEARQGNLAREIASGQDLHIDDFLYQEYEGSCLLDALLVTVPYALTGGSGYSLKLVTLLISCLILYLSILVALELPRKRPAAIFIVLYTFAPTYFITFHFHSVGGSIYGSLFNVLIFFTAIKIIRNPCRALYLLWGFLCATGIYLNPSCLPGILMSFIIIFIAKKRLLISRQMLFFLLCFAASTILYALLFGFEMPPAMGMVSELFLSRDFSEIRPIAAYQADAGFWRRIMNLIFHDLPHSFYFKGIEPYGTIYCVLAFALLIVSFAAIGRGWKKMCFHLTGKQPPDGNHLVPAFINLYIAVYFLLYAFSDIFILGSPEMLYYDVLYKFFYNIYPFIFLSIAYVLDELLQRYSGFKKPILALCAAAILPAAVGTALLIKPAQLTLASKFRPYDYKYLGRMLPGSFPEKSTEKAISLCMEKEEPQRPDCIKGVAIDCRMRERSMSENFKKAESCCSRFPARDRWLCVRGLGNRIMENFFLDAGSVIEFCEMFEPAQFDHCIQGYLEEIGGMIYRESPDNLALLKFRDESQKTILWDNMGYWVFYIFRFNPEWSLSACEKLERKLNVKGCGNMVFYNLGMLKGSGPDSEDTGAGDAYGEYGHITSKYKKDFYEGLGFSYAWKFYPSKEKAFVSCRKPAGEEYRRACDKGVEQFHAMMEQQEP